MKKLLLFKKDFLAYKGRVASLLGLTLLLGFFEGFNISLFYPLMEYIDKGAAALTERKFAYLAAIMGFLGLPLTFGNFIILIFIAATATLTLSLLIKLLAFHTYFPVIKRIRDEAFRRTMGAPMRYFSNSNSGRMVNIVENEADSVGQALNFITVIVVNSATLVIYLAVSFCISWQLSLVVCAMAALRYGIVGFFVKNVRNLGGMANHTVSAIKSYIVQVFQGIDVIKTCHTEAREVKRFEGLTGEALRYKIDGSAWQEYSQYAGEVLGVALVCVMFFLSYVTLGLSSSSLLLLLFLIIRIIPKVNTINDARLRISFYLSQINFLAELFERPVEEEGAPRRTLAKAAFENELVFENVGFGYDGGGFRLEGLDLRLRRNEFVAVVGESGSGKTTFARLLLRLYTPTSGRITMDGVDTNLIRNEDWKRLISVVSQETFIFDDTVENNVAYGVDSYTTAEFEEAIGKANARDFIESLPMKAREPLGERGVRLSGGQRQRLAIARAFMRDTPILILDEATSALDSVTEQQIQQSLDVLSGNRTMIVIAHRLSTIKHADRIMVFDKGRLAEVGRHDELLAKNGIYSEYYKRQKLT